MDVCFVAPGHATVDAKVDGVGEEDAGVDEHGHRVGQLVVNEVHPHAGDFAVIFWTSVQTFWP